ncbi:MAG TPA: PP2C family protein-serine/threonine phosphatase [Thermoanaerobaculia bacterium]|jgi:serine phosphatase RsbU (regulator of sigma subunit)|nr:PP2C family protein-serine/threonine phosphatase [Thermoanaerobaculia bacterium]
MTESARALDPQAVSPSRFFRRSVISVLIGVAVTFLTTFDVSPEWRLRLLTYGGLSGLLINACCHILARAFSGWLARHPEGGRLLLAALYFVGGLLGLTIATGISAATSLVPLSSVRSFLPLIALTSSGIAVAVGLVFYAFGVLENRLRESVVRLKEHEFAEKELELAREIQQCLLPPQEIEGDGYRLAARNEAARFVAGDFYDVFRLADGAVGIVVADVAGKGIGASLVMASVKAMLPLIAADRTVEETLGELNRKLSADLGPREFVALAYLKYETSGAFTLGNAGLPDPYQLAAGKPLRTLSVPGQRMPLGARGESRYEALSGRLEPGERILLLTDGLPEALMATDEPMGYPALESLLAGSDSVGPSDFLDDLFRHVREVSVPTIQDDLTALVLERRLRPA